MSYLRVSVGTWRIDLNSAQGSEIFQKIGREGLQLFRRQPGFIDYRLMKMDAHTTVAVAEWESRELRQRGAQNFRAWLRDSGILEHLSLTTYDGDIVVGSRAAAEKQSSEAAA